VIARTATPIAVLLFEEAGLTAGKVGLSLF